MPPALVRYASEAEYRTHYLRRYCSGGITTFDGIRVFFSRNGFGHAFYESTNRDGVKDAFSPARAQRIDWIKATLETRDALLYQGWNKQTRSYDPSRRVCLAYEDFIVVIGLRLSAKGSLKGKFITCYVADNSIGKIRRSPLWRLEDCLEFLGKRCGR